MVTRQKKPVIELFGIRFKALARKFRSAQTREYNRVNLNANVTEMLLNPWVLGGVIGGTAFAVVVTYSFSGLFKVAALVLKAFTASRQSQARALGEVIRFASALRLDPHALEKRKQHVRNAFFLEGLELIANGVSQEDVREIMSRTAAQARDDEQAEARMLAMVGRFPPACGLIVTLLSLLSLVPNFGSGSLADLQLPLGLAFAATLYGVALSHLLFLPLAASLERHAESQARFREMIVASVLMIHEKLPVAMLRERLKSHLSKDERKKLVEILRPVA